MLLELDGVTKQFRGLVAVDNVTFAVSEREILGLIGANGAGKTTVFGLIAGHHRPTSGRILLDGRRIDGLRPDQINRQRIARTFQIDRPFSAMTVLENVMVGSLFGSGRDALLTRAEKAAADILVEVGLVERAGDLAGSLTLVDRKRLEIARALATRPRLLLLDEVMAGLTPTEIVATLDMIRRLHDSRKLTVIVIEHVMRALMELCQRIVVLHHGRLISEGTPDDVAGDERVVEAYLGTRR